MTHRRDTDDARDPPARPADHGAAPLPDAELAALFTTLRDSLGQERGVLARVRAWPSARRVLLPLAAAMLMTGVVSTWVPRAANFQFYPPLRLGCTLLAYAGLFVLLVASALRPLQRVEHSRMVVIALGLLAFATPFSLAAWPTTTVSSGAGPRQDCFAIAMAIGAALIWLLRRLDRNDAFEPRARMLAAAAGGLAANFALVFHCTDNSALHLVFVHAPAGLLLWLFCAIGAGLAASWAMLARRRHAR